MGGRKSTNSLWACFMCSALNISIKFHSAFLYAIVFGHHVLMCGSTTRGLNFSQFSEYQIFGRKCAEYQILSKTSDLLNILTYTKIDLSLRGEIDSVAEKNWFATFVAKYILVIHFFKKKDFHFESCLRRIIQHKKGG